MADLDVDRARGVGVAVPPASPEDYHEAAAQRQPGFVATADATEPGRGWTTQMRDAEGREDVGEGDRIAYLPPHDQLPGQVYTPDQLPDPQAAINAGLPPVKVPEHLVVSSDEGHIQGPEPSDLAIKEERNRLRAKIVEYRDDIAKEGEAIEARIRAVGESDSDGGGSKSSNAKGGKQAATNAANSGGGTDVAGEGSNS